MTCLSLRVLHYCICLRLTCTPGCVCVCVCVCWGEGEGAGHRKTEVSTGCLFSPWFQDFLLSILIFSLWTIIDFCTWGKLFKCFLFHISRKYYSSLPLFKNLSKFFYRADSIVLCCFPSAVKHRVSEWCLLSYSLSPSAGYQVLLTLLRQSPAGIHLLFLKNIRANT